MSQAGGNPAGPDQVSYAERLRAPVSWWLLGVFFAGSVWLAYQAALGPRVSVPVAAVTAGVIAIGIISYGRVRVAVDPTGLIAGRAALPTWAIGGVEVLDDAATKAASGRNLDVRAFTLIRGYIPTAVQVGVADAADPVPYWLVSTRHPDRLAAALNAARASTAGRQREP